MRKCASLQVCLCTSEMKVKLHIYVFSLLIHASFAVWQHKTVLKGRTLDLQCPLKPQPQSHPVEWKNPDGNVMFFNTIKGVKDKRYSLIKLSESEFIVRITDVTFSDGGKYTCSHYVRHAEDKTVEVTVLGKPQMEFVTHDGKTVIKCTAEGNYPPPVISWQFRNGPQFRTHAELTREDKKFVSSETITIEPTEKTIHVKCIVRHPAWHSQPMMDFKKITPNRKPKHPRTTTSSTETTAAVKTTTEITTDPFSSTQKEASEFSTTAQFSTSDAADPVTTNYPVTTSPSNTTDGSTVFPDSTTQNQTSSIWNTTAMTTVAITTNISFNETKTNSTENGYDVERRKENVGNASLLVFLVTCLILGLLVVVLFIGIKLRRAHIAWKRENEDTDTSETSSKSKISQEDKNGQRRRGFFNTGVTQYVVQEPTVITSVVNPGAMASPEGAATNEQSSPVQMPPQTTAKSKVKETEL